MKTAISTYSYTRLLKSGEMDFHAVLDKTKEIGFDGVELAHIDDWGGDDCLTLAVDLRDYCAKIGLPVVSTVTAADFINGSGGDLEAEVRRVCRIVDMAAVMGAPVMRHDAVGRYPADGSYRTFSDMLPRLADGIRRVAAYAEGKGVRTMVENHGFVCQDSTRVEALAAAVAHKNFGLLVDVGNFVCADEDPAVAVGRVAHLAFHVHVKDMIVKDGNGQNPGRAFGRTRAGNYMRGTIIGHGSVPVVKCLAALKKAGYDGYVSMEFEGIEDTITGIQMGYENLRSYIQQV